MIEDVLLITGIWDWFVLDGGLGTEGKSQNIQIEQKTIECKFWNVEIKK